MRNELHNFKRLIAATNLRLKSATALWWGRQKQSVFCINTCKYVNIFVYVVGFLTWKKQNWRIAGKSPSSLLSVAALLLLLLLPTFVATFCWHIKTTHPRAISWITSLHVLQVHLHTSPPASGRFSTDGTSTFMRTLIEITPNGQQRQWYINAVDGNNFKSPPGLS